MRAFRIDFNFAKVGRRILHKLYFSHKSIVNGEGNMNENQLTAVTDHAKCDHMIHRSYTQKRFDILYGFELNLTRCINCHTTLSLEVKKLN
jgi:hypothetical protein